MAFLTSANKGSAPQDLFGSAPQTAAYLNQGGLPGPLGDVGSIGGLLGGAGSAIGALTGALPTGGLSLLADVPSLISGLTGMFSGRSSTGPGSATSDIAAASSSSDPILALLGSGAGSLGSGTPLSSPAAGPTFGPYFNAARDLENVLRFGAGAANNPTDLQLTAQTLQNTLHDLGNPGNQTGTENAVTKLWTDFVQKGGDIQQLIKQLPPDQQQQVQQVLRQQQPSGNPLLNSSNPLSALGSLAPLLLAGQIINPMQPIRLPDVSSGDDEKKKKQKQVQALQQLGLL